MKNFDLAQTTSVLANLGVIAGIIFLAMELQQNNQLLAANQRESQNQRIFAQYEDIYEGPHLPGIVAKAKNGLQLSDVEEMRLTAFNLRQLRGFQAQYVEFIEGTTDFFPLPALRRLFHLGGAYSVPLRESWQDSKEWLLPSFVRFVEENVVSQEAPEYPDLAENCPSI